MQNAGNCRTTSIPIPAWHTRRIVVPGLRRQAGQILCIDNEPSEQNSARWISTQRKWEELIVQRRTSLEPSVVPGPPTGDTEIPRSDPEGEDHSSARDVKGTRGEPEHDLSGEITYSKCRRDAVTSRDPCCAIRFDSVKFDFNSDFSWSLFKQWCETYIQREYHVAEVSWYLVRQWCETFTR